ncbi:uncharacterized protein LOC131208254 [Anopheles bellator]|uniref:uncharacterized protein LOC131208254 n=1 Tax=Anopheles bellator TaxID=139047 RepID=UPI002648BA9D|nr:uncharacterized protein LOC131208254 [Anopheles bellator]
MKLDQKVLKRIAWGTLRSRSFTKPANVLPSEERKPVDYGALDTLHPLATIQKPNIVGHCVQMLYGMRDFYHDLIGSAEVQTAQDKIDKVQHEISVVLEKHGYEKQALHRIKIRIARFNDTQHSDGLDLDMLLLEKQRLKDVMDELGSKHHLLQLNHAQAVTVLRSKERQQNYNTMGVKLVVLLISGAIGVFSVKEYIFQNTTVKNLYTNQDLHMKTVDEDLKSIKENMEKSTKMIEGLTTRNLQTGESWLAYLYKQPERFYRYMVPKQEPVECPDDNKVIKVKVSRDKEVKVPKQESEKELTNETWSGYLWRQPTRFYRYMVPKQEPAMEQSNETWSGYLWRQPTRFYRYMVPKQEPAMEQSNETWSGYLWRQPTRLYRYMVPKQD